jgi:hypothetical protein
VPEALVQWMLGGTEPRDVILQAGAFGEHEFTTVRQKDGWKEIAGRWFTVHLRPGAFLLRLLATPAPASYDRGVDGKARTGARTLRPHHGSNLSRDSDGGVAVLLSSLLGTFPG